MKGWGGEVFIEKWGFAAPFLEKESLEDPASGVPVLFFPH